MLEKGYLGEKTGSGFFQKTDQRDEKGGRVILGLDPRTVEYRLPKKARFDCVSAARSLHTVAEKIKVMHTSEDEGSKFVWDLFARTAIYAANRIPEVADDIVNIDNAVKWGFGWKVGIFETWDILGFDYACDRMKADGLQLPRIAEAMLARGAKAFYKYDETGTRCYFDVVSEAYKPVPRNPGQIVLADIKKGFGVSSGVSVFDSAKCVVELQGKAGKVSLDLSGVNVMLGARNAGGVLVENEFASLIDMGDGICCVEFHSKMNTLERFLAEIIVEGINRVNSGEFDGMIIANQEEHFCAGANLMIVLGMAMQNDWNGLTTYIDGFQQINMALRFCRGPVVAAPHNYCFGGGVELCQHSARVVISGETYGGLVEFGVGLIPAGGGTKEMLRRALAYAPDTITEATPYPYLRRAFEAIGMAKVSMSGPEMIELGYFTENDVICVNWDHQVKRAKDVCRALVLAGYRPPRPARLTALGEPMKSVFRAALYQMRLSGYVSEHDELVAMHLAHTLTGGSRPAGAVMSEQDVLDLEREAMLSLCGTEKTQQRMQHMLATGKPLRN
jgi:3-hydroxyacyl-CoA dehydrogenase